MTTNRRGIVWSLAWIAAVALGTGAAKGEAAAAEAERAAVIAVVQSAYVDGIHNFRDPEAIRAGFHPDFEMLILREGRLEKLPIAKWIEAIEARNAKEPPPTDGVRTSEASYPLVEVTGSAAVCKVELVRGGKLVFTDYLSLYKFPEGWKIVGKIFYRHPAD